MRKKVEALPLGSVTAPGKHGVTVKEAKNRRTALLECLSSGPKTREQVADSVGMLLIAASNLLGRAKKLGIVEIVGGSKTGQRYSKPTPLWGLTKEGERMHAHKEDW